MTTELRQGNPYVGPRPFEPSDADYFRGRNKEIRDLINLLIAERLVLLYSPSGAGKTSLLQAAVIPRLEHEGEGEESQESEEGERLAFRVWPMVRVGEEPGPELPLEANRYIFSMLKSLEQKWSTESLPAEKLAHLSLAEYAEIRQDTLNSPGFDVFIFDKFEEILSLDSADIQVKKDFFSQLGIFLKPRERFALFAIKEGYLGALDPYLHYLPTQFRTVYRLDFLGKKAALQAIREPAQEAGGDFEEKAADQLVEDLSTVKVQKSSGDLAPEPDQVIDPLLLQVVCQGLWEQSPGGHIGKAELEKFGDVGQALAKYYRQKVGDIASQAAQGDADEAVKIERKIRHWFSNELTTPQGARKVWKEEGTTVTAGLENILIEGLVQDSLVREVQQRDISWYELARTRLITPIREDNDAWFRETLSPLQHRAELYYQHPDDSLLMTGGSVGQAKKWAQSHPKQMTRAEDAFLTRCLQRRRRTRLLAGLAVGIFILGVLTFMAGAYAIYQGRLARARELSAKAVAELNLDPEQSIHLALDAAEVLGQGVSPGPLERVVLWARGVGEKFSPGDGRALNEVEDALQRAVQASRAIKVIKAHKGIVTDLACSPNGELLVTAGKDKTVKIWDVETWDLLYILPHDQQVWRVFFRPDGKQLLTVADDKEACLWDLATGREQHPPQRRSLKHDETVFTAAYNHNGALVATAGKDGTVKVWNSHTAAQVGLIPAQGKFAIYDVTFSPQNRYLATAGRGGITVWALKDILEQNSLGQQATLKPLMHWSPRASTLSLVFGPKGRLLASQGSDGSLEVYDLDSEKSWGAPGDKNALPVFSPDGKQLALGKGLDILLYDAATGKQVSELSGHTDNVFQVAFVGPYLISCSADGTVKIWDRDAKKVIVTLRGHTNPISRFAFTQKNGNLFTGGWDGTVRLWYCKFPHSDRITGFAFSPKGGQLATTSNDNTLYLWNFVSGSPYCDNCRQNLKETGGLAFDPHGKVLAGKSGKRIYLWDAKNLKHRETIKNPTEVTDMAFSPNGRYLAYGTYDGWGACIWKFDADMNLRGEKPFRVLNHRGAICVAFSHDSKILATGDSDGKLRLWNVATGKPLQKWSGHERNVLSIAFSPKEELLASGSLDQTVKVWDVTPKPGLCVSPHPLWKKKFSNRVDCVVFDRKGERLAIVCRDLTARIFDAHSGRELRTYHFSHVVSSVDFTPDNTELVIAGFHNELYYYPLDFKNLLEVATNHAKRLWKGKNKSEDPVK
jgi:WD40 repeat protein